MTWVSAGVAGASLVSNLFGAKKQKKAQQELMNYQRSLRLDPVTGQFGQISVNNGSVNAGAFGGLQDAFSGAAGDVLGGIDFSGGLPPEVQSALSMFQGNLSPNVNPMLGGLFGAQRQAGAVGSQALQQILGGNNQIQIQPELMAQLFGGASGLAGDVGRSYNDVRDSTLGSLRASALPENQRAVDSTLSRLFAQGRLGSTGGANIIGRLAESQNQQDLGFQLAAGQEARNASTDVTNRFSSLLSGGLNLSSQNLNANQQAMQDAFARFSGATNIGLNANETAFGRTSGLEATGFDRLAQNLQAVTGLSSLPTQLQSGRIGLSSQLAGQATSIQDLINAAFNNALNGATAATNVRLAGAGLNTQLQSSPGYSASPIADAFGSLLAGATGPNTGISDLLAKLGNRKTQATPIDRFQTL